jgi:hypothetical protein
MTYAIVAYVLSGVLWLGYLFFLNRRLRRELERQPR